MIHAYSATNAQGRPITWRDHKRGWWALSVVYPLLPLLGIWGHHACGWPNLLGLPLLIGHGLMPMLDALLGEDLNDPPEAVVPQLDADRYYRWLTWATSSARAERPR